MTAQQAMEKVKAKWPDAELYCDVSRNGAYAVGSPHLGVTIGKQSWSMNGAWIEAATELSRLSNKEDQL